MEYLVHPQQPNKAPQELRRTLILVVGQTPPPIHGQSLATAYLLEGSYPDLEFVHVRMSFSSSIGEVGRYAASPLA